MIPCYRGEYDPRVSKRLRVRELTSGRKFLVDTGADISVLPAAPGQRPQGIKIYAANDTVIDTFGESTLTLNLGLRRPIVWNFCIRV